MAFGTYHGNKGGTMVEARIIFRKRLEELLPEIEHERITQVMLYAIDYGARLFGEALQKED